VEGTLLLRLDIHQIPAIWQTIGEDFVAKIIRPTVRSRIRMVASRFLFRYCGSKRDQVENELKNERNASLCRGIFVENVCFLKLAIFKITLERLQNTCNHRT
jgi:hypothetical protein